MVGMGGYTFLLRIGIKTLRMSWSWWRWWWSNRPVWIFWFLLNCDQGNPASFQSFHVYSPKNKLGQMCVYAVDSTLQNNREMRLIYHVSPQEDPMIYDHIYDCLSLFHKKHVHYKEPFFLSVTRTWQPSRFCCETHIFYCPLPVSSWGHKSSVFLPTPNKFHTIFSPLLVLTTCFWRYTACSVVYCIALSSQWVTEKWREENEILKFQMTWEEEIHLKFSFQLITGVTLTSITIEGL